MGPGGNMRNKKLKILQVTNFCHMIGGGSRYFFEVSKLLRSKGHQVAYFCMDDKKNIKTKWSKYFVRNIPMENRSLVDNFRLFCRTIYSLEAQNKISRLLDDFKPDIVHLHDFYHYISPSILIEFKKRNIPMVMTVHDYHLISPNRNMFHNGRICEISKPERFYKSANHKCVGNSYLLSLVETIEKYFWSITNWHRKYIDYFISPSNFMKSKIIEYGYNRKKNILMSLFVKRNKFNKKSNKNNYILYFGRISPEKGLKILIHSMSILPHIPLKIVGRGLQQTELMNLNHKLKNRNVKFLGYKSGSELKELISNCKFSVLPSIWFDVAPISILESFAFGKPIVASNIGGISELVKDRYNGFLVTPGNIMDLSNKISELWENESFSQKLGMNARSFVEKNFSPEEHYKNLMEIYRLSLREKYLI